MSGFEMRVAVLHIDRETDLPLMYSYDAEENTFRTMGFVRLEGRMVVSVGHVGRDTPVERDRFLLKVLEGVAVPTREAQRIVRDAEHISDT